MRTNDLSTICERDFVDVAPFGLSRPTTFGSATLWVQVKGTNGPVDIVFASSITSLFGDFYAASNSGSPLRMALMFSDGTTSEFTVPGTGTSLDPFGFSSTKAITSLQFRNTINDGFALDHIIGSVAATPPSMSVPEPSTYLMLGTGLLLLGGMAHRWRQV